MIVMRRLGDICHTTSGGTPSRSRSEFYNGNIPWVKSGDLNDGIIFDVDEKITEAAIAASSAKIFPTGTLLLAMYGATVGKLAVLGIDAATNQAVCGITPERCLDRDFLFHYLFCKREDLISRSVGGAQPNISQGIIRDLLVPVPPLDEQRRIVDILDHAASIRRLREQAQEKVREIIPALFVDMFGDPATNPKGWPVKALGDIIDRFEGGKNLQAGDDVIGSGFRILKVSAVTSGRFIGSESKPAPNDYASPRNHFVRKDDLLFSRANTVDLVGATAFVREQPANILLPDKLWRFVWKKQSVVLPFFMLHFLQQRHTRAAMSRMATGTSDSMKNISQAKLVRLPTLVPPLTLQQEFAERVSEVEAMATLGDTATHGAERLAQSLMSQVFGQAAA